MFKTTNVPQSKVALGKKTKIWFATILQSIVLLSLNLFAFSHYFSQPCFKEGNLVIFWTEGVCFLVVGLAGVIFVKWKVHPFTKLFSLALLLSAIPSVLFQLQFGPASLFLIFGSLGAVINLFALEYVHAFNKGLVV